MKTVVITGASSGIGYALAKEYAARGYSLGLAARSLDKLQTLKLEIEQEFADKNIQVFIQVLDVNNPMDVAKDLNILFQSLGHVDILIANAGINNITKVGSGVLERELQVIQTNVIGAIATVDAAVTYFKQQGYGHVVGISSLASLMAIPTQAAYCASKAAFSMYLESARIELSGNNILFTIVTPGFIKTDIVANIEKYPFAISSQQAALEMAILIAKKRKTGIVPAYPWKYLKPIFGFIPDSYWKKFL